LINKKWFSDNFCGLKARLKPKAKIVREGKKCSDEGRSCSNRLSEDACAFNLDLLTVVVVETKTK
jgi:hypothetical protein